jgi:hypothetical protein
MKRKNKTIIKEENFERYFEIKETDNNTVLKIKVLQLTNEDKNDEGFLNYYDELNNLIKEKLQNKTITSLSLISK